MIPSTERALLVCLTGLALSLVLVGIVSGTIVRHLVQILPIVAAAGVLARRPALGAYAALPIFLFWILIVVLIWLFLLGLSRIANGHYTVLEVVSTVFMAGFSAAGVRSSVVIGRPLRPIGRVLAAVLFACLQTAAMWISFLKPIASR